MKIAFVSTWDPDNPNIWAGTGYHMVRALQRNRRSRFVRKGDAHAPGA